MALPRRIALVGPLPPPAGGMANQTRQLAELLRGEGVEVEVVQVNAPYRPAWAGRLRGLRAVFRMLPYLLGLWRATGRADLIHVMANSGWSWHLFAAPAIWVAWLRRRPVVVNYRGGEAGAFLARSAPLVSFSMRRVRALVLPSRFLLEVFERYGMPGVVVPNIVDLQRFRPDPARRFDPVAPHCVVARNLESIYGNDLALRAFARIMPQAPGARLTVAGSGPEENRLKALADTLGIADRVLFTGRLDRDQMAALYREADLMLNPTHVDNMPNSVLEALASGLPVISTCVGGVPYIVEDTETALLVPPNDPDALATAIRRLLGDPALAAHLRQNGLQAAAQYSWPRVRETLLSVYSNAMSRIETV